MLPARDQRASGEAEPRLSEAVHVDFDMAPPSQGSQAADRPVRGGHRALCQNNNVIKHDTCPRVQMRLLIHIHSSLQAHLIIVFTIIYITVYPIGDCIWLKPPYLSSHTQNKS